jgi:hypothetical protein
METVVRSAKAQWRRLVGMPLALLLTVLTAQGACDPAPAAASEPEVVTAAADNLRTGWYPGEASLTPQLLDEGKFEQAFSTPVQGQMYAQPLVANGVLLAATEQDWVYGLDPSTGGVLWQRQVGTPLNASVLHCWPIEPYVGITGTPVIDTASNVAYFLSISYVSADSGPVAWYMHAVDLATGEEQPNFPVRIEGEAQNLPGTSFQPERELQRPALLLMNGVVYAAFGGDHCDEPPYQGWVVGVSTAGQIKAMWASATEGASIWQSGGGLVSDGPGRILLATGNGVDGVPSPPAGPGNSPPAGLGESLVRLAVQEDGELQAADFFAPSADVFLDEADLDQGSGAPMALPSQYFGTPSTPDLLVQAGKTGEVYLLNDNSLGGMGQGLNGTNDVVQELGPYGGVWDGPAAWPGDGGYVYLPAVSPSASNDVAAADYLRFFKYSVDGAGDPRLSLAATSTDQFAYGSGSPIVTSNGTTNGSAILWTMRCPLPELQCTEAELRAYAAVPSGNQPVLLWSAPIGFGPKFAHPDASDGRIYVGTRGERVIGFAATASAPIEGSGIFFPATSVGEGSTRTETITAKRAVEITNVSSEDPRFVVGMPSRALPASLAAGESLEVAVTYSPAEKEQADAKLTVQTSRGSATFSLAGTGLDAALTPSEAKLDLGSATTGSRLERSVEFVNTGEVPLTVSAVRAPSRPFGADGLPAIGATISRGQAVMVDVAFDSATPGAFAGSLGITTQGGTTSVALSASATPALQGSNLAFAPTIIGESATRTDTITANTTVNVEGISSESPQFALAEPPLPASLSAGQSLEVPVTYTPTARGAVASELVVKTSAGSATFGLSGSGVAAAPTPSPTTPGLGGALAATAPALESALGPGLTAPSFSPGSARRDPVSTPATLSRLKVSPRPANGTSHSNHQLYLIYSLSRRSRVEVAIARRVISHYCADGSRSCASYLSPRTRLTVSGRAGINRLIVNTAQLSPGRYRVAATPLTSSGEAPVTRYGYFTLMR